MKAKIKLLKEVKIWPILKANKDDVLNKSKTTNRYWQISIDHWTTRYLRTSEYQKILLTETTEDVHKHNNL